MNYSGNGIPYNTHSLFWMDFCAKEERSSKGTTDLSLVRDLREYLGMVWVLWLLEKWEAMMSDGISSCLYL